MYPEQHQRTIALIGMDAFQKLQQAHVMVFGLGGVGSYLTEALARAGIGQLTIIDHDTVSLSNCNRQLPALHSTIGMPKTAVIQQRIADINPACQVTVKDCFFSPETADQFSFADCSFVADAIDTVTAKLLLIERAKAANVPVISCMGTGNKLDPSRFRITDYTKTQVCPLARVMRLELRKRGMQDVPVLWSDEPPKSAQGLGKTEHGKPVPASISYVPSVAGLLMAGYIIRHFTEPHTT